MKIFLVRLKNHPELYVGKKSVSYAFKSDNFLKESKDGIDEDCYHFVPRAKAKIWDNDKNLKWLHSYCGKYYSDKLERDVMSTFSEYEVEIDDNGKISWVSFDEFVKCK
jgi:hypothetical protein